MICSGCEDNKHDRCLDGQMLSSEKPWAIECDCASQEHDYKKRKPMSPTTVDVSTIKEYGLTQKLSNQIRVY